MLLYLAVIIFGLMSMTFLGYFFHWIFHQKWSGRLNIAHKTHHNILYPPKDFVSDVYRNPKKDNTVYLFGLVFAPFILTAFFLTVFRIIPLGIGLIILGEMAIVGTVNNFLHDAFHLKNSFWHKFWFFPRLKRLHYNHHVRQNTNFGIFSFVWDRVFHTYNNK
jgi:sterol desaturase/sphingolipid hydroxylase (fatty acid hydroxylase superfamily)